MTTITPDPSRVRDVLVHAQSTLGAADAEFLADIVSRSWEANAGAPARSQAAFACVEVAYVAAKLRAGGNPALARHLDLLAEAFALAWRAEVDASATPIPNDTSGMA